MTRPPTPPPSRVERRYRTLLRLLPEWYRAGREEEMVSVYLDGGCRGPLDWPDFREWCAILALSTRAWLRGNSAAARRPMDWRDVVQRMALLGLVLQFGPAIFVLFQVFFVVRPGSIHLVNLVPTSQWWLELLVVLSATMTGPALWALIRNHRGWGRALAAVSATAAVLTLGFAISISGSTFVIVLLRSFTVWLTLAAVIVGFAEPSRRSSHSRGWLLAAGMSVTLTVLAVASQVGTAWVGVAVLVTGTLMCVATSLTRRRAAPPSVWPLVILPFAFQLLTASGFAASTVKIWGGQLGARLSPLTMIVLACVFAILLVALLARIQASRHASR